MQREKQTKTKKRNGLDASRKDFVQQVNGNFFVVDGWTGGLRRAAGARKSLMAARFAQRSQLIISTCLTFRSEPIVSLVSFMLNTFMLLMVCF